jgi:hypothetical protein
LSAEESSKNGGDEIICIDQFVAFDLVSVGQKSSKEVYDHVDGSLQW